MSDRAFALRFARWAAAVAAALGLLALLGWVTGRLGLAAIASERIPMAPSTALLFLVNGGALLLFTLRPDDRRLRGAVAAVTGASALLALALLVALARGAPLELEHPGIRHVTTADGVPIGHISPVTAALFLLTGVALLSLVLLPPGRARWSLVPAFAAGLVEMGGFVLSMAYLLGEPLLHGGTLIPPALSTSLAFLALGGALLLLSVVRGRAADRRRDPADRRAVALMIGILGVAAASVAVAAHAYFTRYEKRFRSGVMDSLGAIAELKVHELALWRQERLGDGSLLGGNLAFLDLVRRLLDDPQDEAPRARLRSWFDGLRTSYGYHRIELLDAEGRERIASGDRPVDVRAPFAHDVPAILRGEEVAFLDFHRVSPQDPTSLALLVPLRGPAEEGLRALGVVVLEIDPETYLYPMLRRWPTSSRTAETLLVRRDGDDVLILNDLEFRDGTALRLRFPLSEPRLPAAIAARGGEGDVEGIDYRGRRVLAALRAVPDSPWRLVARIDEAEALAPARERLWSLVALLAALLLGVIAALTAVWQRNAKAHYRELATAQGALAHSEATLRTIFESVADAIVIADAGSHRLVRANAAFFRMLGYRPQDLERLTVEDLHPPHEATRAAAAFDRQLHGEVEVAPDLMMRRADGSVFVAAINAVALDLEGRRHLLGVFRDVSERNRAEKHIAHLNSVLRAIRNVNQLITRERDRDRLIQKACDLLVEARDFGGVVIGLVDEESGRIVARASAGNRRGSVADDGGPEAVPEVAREAMARRDVVIREHSARSPGAAAQTSEGPEAEDVVAFSLDQEGECFGFMLVSLVAGMSDDAEELELLREAASDIAFALRSMEVEAARDRSRAELSDREAQLRQAQKLEAIGGLAGGIAHDFNNLLMVILGYCGKLVEEMEAADPRRQDVEEIASAGHRAANLTRQLLAFSRSQALQVELLDLNLVIANMEAMLGRLLGEDIELVTQPAAGLGSVEADPGQIEQVLMNLAVNARDAMPRGGKLTITTAEVRLDEEATQRSFDAPAGSYVKLTVSDSGCGMDEATLSHIFEPFFSTKPKGTGTGLGLSTVYGIVKQSKGSIRVESRPGSGTTFEIYLPRVAGAPRPPERFREPEVGAVRGAGQQLLIVEDEAALRNLLQTLLTGLGYRVTLAADGREALAAIEERGLRPDLLLTDVVMPGMSGSQLADELRRTRPDLRVLLMSGYSDEALGHHGVHDPGTTLLQKPFTAAELASKVGALLGLA